jgi:hypothetical protein
VSGGAHAGGGAEGTTARSIIGDSASGLVVTKQSFSGRSISVTSFKTPRPLTGPERRHLSQEGFVATKSNNELYYCRRANAAAGDMECFGPAERSR